MFYHDSKLQYPVKVETPNPLFAKLLQQAIGGVEGEMRVALQYLFQAWGARGPAKYRSMLLETACEEIGHIEMLATAVALNLEGAPNETVEEAAKDPAVAAVLGGMNPRHILSTTLAAMPMDSQGVPFDASHVYASGNIAADMLANVTAESTGRMLAVKLHNYTDDPGMKDMLKYMIARDTMHQNQWLAVWEEVGGKQAHPIPNSFPQAEENQSVNYTFYGTKRDKGQPTQGAWSQGASPDGKGTFKSEWLDPMGQELGLPPAQAWQGVQQDQVGK
ncbi:manganese catalase family protein [Alienimonas californiensis]|uniref:Putative manganese catalase n=1 Tax=Alienimonas californiensis TaxID=2527989 RepID=A0A517P6G5_9PLAN|nr:manganese catalase family protein [Alienimonas californiensis]QDT14971.1 putative manganese catalase [Alienimonas californiensis]